MCCGSCATGSLCLACVLRDACPAPAWQACARFRPLALAYNVSRWQTMPARGLQRPSDHRQDINCLPLTQRTYLRNYALPPVYLKLQPLLISCCVAGDEACLSGAWRQGAGMDHPRAQLSVRARSRPELRLAYRRHTGLFKSRPGVASQGQTVRPREDMPRQAPQQQQPLYSYD